MSLSIAGAAAVFAAGAAAGTVNSVAGAGSLVTFPTLVALGYGAVTANVSNTVGLVPGGVTSAIGYRTELAGFGQLLRRLAPWSLAGGLLGGVLLLVLPSSVFRAVIPVLVGVAGLLVLVQPWLARALLERRRRAAVRNSGGAPGGAPGVGAAEPPSAIHAGVGTALAVFVSGVYGGYFGAAQGVFLLGILGIGLPLTLQQANGVKNTLAALVNGVSALYFIAVGHVAWEPALLVAAGSVVGGGLGSRYGRRVPAQVLRPIVAAIGIGVAVALALR